MSKILFMGSDAVTLPLLEALKKRAGALLVVSQPDRPHGRGQKLTPNAVSDWALKNGVELLRPEKLTEDVLAQLKAFAPDLALVMAYGKLLRQPFLDLAKRGIWNFHGSLLPRLRGASPIETSIALGDKKTGVVLMKMVLAMDAGEVGPVEEIAISPTLTAKELRVQMGVAAAKLLEDSFDALCAGEVKALPQDDAKATFCRILTKEDAWLDFDAPAQTNVNRIRAFAENIGMGFEYKGEKIKVFVADVGEGDFALDSGTVMATPNALGVVCARKLLLIKELQRPGGKRLPARDFLAGTPIPEKTVLLGRPFRPLEAQSPFPRGF